MKNKNTHPEAGKMGQKKEAHKVEAAPQKKAHLVKKEVSHKVEAAPKKVEATSKKLTQAVSMKSETHPKWALENQTEGLDDQAVEAKWQDINGKSKN